MRTIPLTRGYVAIVDDQDYAALARYKWSAQVIKTTSYVRIYAKRNATMHGKVIKITMHRLIMGVTDPMIEVDHEDHDGLNNRRYNLRVCTKSQNHCNSRPRLGKASVYKGVSWRKSRNKWHAEIAVDGKRIYIGLYPTEIEAATAYNQAALQLHGEFAYLNTI